MPVSGAADDQLLDLRGALVERRHAHVAEVALDRVVVDVARAAVDLDRLVRAPHRGLGREVLGDRRLGRVRAARRPSAAPARQTSIRAASVLTPMSAIIACTSWKPAIGRSNCVRSWAYLTDSSSAAPGRCPTQPAATRVAPGVQRAHRDLEAVADLAEHRSGAGDDVVERDLRGVRGPQAHLARGSRVRLEAGLVGLDEEAGEAAVPERRVGLGEDQRELRVVAERDPHLRAVDRPAAVVLLVARVFWLAASEPVSGSVRPKQPSHSPEHSCGR